MGDYLHVLREGQSPRWHMGNGFVRRRNNSIPDFDLSGG